MVVICWLLFCFLIGKFAQKRGRSFWKFLILSAIISPIGGLIVLIIMGDKIEKKEGCSNISFTEFPIDNQEQISKKEHSIVFCPNCGAKVDSESRFCPNCGKSIY